ncbi:MAG TPA: methyltransferase domain-containing protein [Pyrinomonadaceae bacterium]|jgi:cyclopropane fatty-acyl-phospholipid synthase-like methyltransferase
MIQFEQTQTIDQLSVLEYMYSKHIVSPANLIASLQKDGKFVSDGLAIEDILPYDQDHFGGLKATETCLELLNFVEPCRVLDIGSGLGGPARYISYKTGCSVTGVEIQSDRYSLSKLLTKSIGLEKKVSFIQGDFVSVDFQQTFSHVISFLAILHIIDKELALEKLANTLQSNGKIYLEDYYRKAPSSVECDQALLETISCPSLFDLDHYLAVLHDKKIQVEHVIDMTEAWKRLVVERVENYNQNHSAMSSEFGEEAAANALSFAEGVSRLFQKEIIGGVRITGSKR